MKDVKTVVLSIASPVDIYNRMNSKSNTSLLEAKRTLEALECVKADKRLFNLVKREEDTDDGRKSKFSYF